VFVWAKHSVYALQRYTARSRGWGYGGGQLGWIWLQFRHQSNTL